MSQNGETTKIIRSNSGEKMKSYPNRIAITDDVYRGLEKYMENHESEIKKYFEIGWHKAPTYSQGIEYLLMVANAKKP